METKELPERPERHFMQSERERERRRMRDRQRRQSMSLEEREKHLARRRRNYQLRRQGVQDTKLESHYDQTSSAIRSEFHAWNENQSSVAASGHSVQFDGALHVKPRNKVLNAGIQYNGAEDGAHKSAKRSRRLRLNHIKHLARLVNSPMNVRDGESCHIGADVSREIVNTHCRSRKMLRLTHLKRFARALSTTVKENADQSHLRGTQENQSLPQGECQRMNNEVLTNEQSNNANG